ncbi:MAG: Txe/YoeB family toxin of Txe-Axe toxin-antitoxin module [Candidatus Woesearchaeota archaeon]
MNKIYRVVFIENSLEKRFSSLQKADPLRKSLQKAVMNLKQDAFCGIQVPKRLIPKEYVRKYQLNNLWKYNLVSGWRLLYTVTAENEIDLTTAIIDWFTHTHYERKMNYVL